MTQTINPRQVRYLIGLCANGKIKQSLKEASVLANSHQNDAFIHTHMGSCYYSLGDSENAANSYRRALELEPSNSLVHCHLANALRLGEHLSDAIESYKHALRLKPDLVLAHYYLGYTFWLLGDLTAAVTCFQSAIKCKPDFAEVHSILGNTFFQLGQYDAAVQQLQLALKLKPDLAEAHNNLASTLRALGRTKEAIKSYQKAIISNPNFVEAYNNIGNLLNELGDKNAAIANYEKALAINPNYIKAHVNLSALKLYTNEDNQLKKMRALYQDSDVIKSDHAKLCFSLAKASDDLQLIDKSYEYLCEGNRLRKQALNYSLEEDRRLFIHIRNHFENKPIDYVKEMQNKNLSIQPIFIVGMPRSGTTLVEQIIASHSRVYGAGELGYLEEFLIPKMREGISQVGNETPVLLTTKQLSEMAADYKHKLSCLETSKQIIIDKMPLNFRWIGFILSAFPNAKIINMNRDPVATCWSNYKFDFQSDGIGFVYDLEDLADFYKMYRSLMSFWHKQFPNRIYELSYEGLTENQQQETSKLLDYCELDWEQSCLDYHKTKRQVSTASATQVRQKIYTGSSKVWCKYAEYLQPLTDSLSN